MNYQKYTVDEWLEQFGAWLEQTTQKGGDLPNGLHINQIYWLMQSVNPTPTKAKRTCNITDKEAEEIGNLLKRAIRTSPDGGLAIRTLIENKVEGKSSRYLGRGKKGGRAKIERLVDCGRYYLLGLEMRLNL